MDNTSNARSLFFSRRVRWIIAIVAIIALLMFLTGPKFGQIIEGLTPPKLPTVKQNNKVEWLAQNWSEAVRDEYHHKSQGTTTIPIPLAWLLALEQPGSPYFFWLTQQAGFSDTSYLTRMGFIAGKQTQANPHVLPVGFATTEFVNLRGIDEQVTGVGFTCAACHTGQFSVGDTSYLVDGGPATINLGYFTQALGAALGQTLVSSKLPVFNGRFDRFAKHVLGDTYSDGNKLKLASQLESVVVDLASLPGGIDVIEGSTRLDALNRIGNTVFSAEINRPENYVAINAPVNYPHIWTASWFDWVQYDGSIMQPLVRNSGEAMGVAASVNTTADSNRFSSDIPLQNLKWIEDKLSGPEPIANEQFGGLLSPKWPASLPQPDSSLVNQGAALYAQHCQHCHLPPLDSEQIWARDYDDRDKYEYFDKIKWWEGDKALYSEEQVLRLNLIPISIVGTDPAQANILVERTVNTANTLPPGVPGNNALGINTEVCTEEPVLRGDPNRSYEPPYYEPWMAYQLDEAEQEQKPRLVDVPVRDGPMMNFALALGALVEEVNDKWFELNFINPSQRHYFEGGRPNCLRAGAAYKARPLNGVWATAPFLHNGSIATLTDLLSPPSRRPRYVQLGSTEFDVVNVGVKQDGSIAMDGELYIDGLFILDTSLPGNLNSGHEFSPDYDPNKRWNEQKQGVIGPELSDDEREALIAYLKTL